MNSQEETMEQRFYQKFGGEWSLTGIQGKQDVLAFLKSELVLQKQADCREFEKVIGTNEIEEGINEKPYFIRNQLRTKQHIALDSMRGKI